MKLEEYRAKRDFSKTLEPDGSATGNVSQRPRFVIQEHHASHLHYDFRLEIDGVLKSWAVPKGVPRESGIRSLAVQTEDHPLEYISFEGEIPEGQYGAGSVSIYDTGIYYLTSLEPRKLEFVLEGSKYTGSYALINTGENNWLILKKKEA